MSTPAASLAPLAPILDRLHRDRLKFAAVAVASIAGAVAATQWLLGGAFTSGLSALGTASPTLLLLAGACFVGSLIASAGAWRSTLRACGASLDRADACARYGVGSLVNTFAPARLGDAARVLLFSATLPKRGGRAITAGGALAVVGLARALVQAAVVAAAATLGPLPIRSAFVLAGLVSVGIVAVVVGRNRLSRTCFDRLSQALRLVAASPQRAVRLVGWTAAAAALRVTAGMAVVAALGIPGWLAAGLIVCAVLGFAALIPLTPGNLGITSAAVALALQARGVPVTSALAAGIAFHAVETATGLLFGAGSVLFLARHPSARARRASLQLAGAACCLAIVATVGVLVTPELV